MAKTWVKGGGGGGKDETEEKDKDKDKEGVADARITTTVVETTMYVLQPPFGSRFRYRNLDIEKS